jgi:hypothetical protein
VTFGLEIKMATKWCALCGYNGHSNDSYPMWDTAGWPGFYMTTQNGLQLKMCELFNSGNFHLKFLEQGWLWVTETAKGETVEEGKLLYFLVCSFVWIQ